MAASIKAHNTTSSYISYYTYQRLITACKVRSKLAQLAHATLSNPPGAMTTQLSLSTFDVRFFLVVMSHSCVKRVS